MLDAAAGGLRARGIERVPAFFDAHNLAVRIDDERGSIRDAHLFRTNVIMSPLGRQKLWRPSGGVGRRRQKHFVTGRTLQNALWLQAKGIGVDRRIDGNRGRV